MLSPFTVNDVIVKVLCLNVSVIPAKKKPPAKKQDILYFVCVYECVFVFYTHRKDLNIVVKVSFLTETNNEIKTEVVGCHCFLYINIFFVFLAIYPPSFAINAAGERMVRSCSSCSLLPAKCLLIAYFCILLEKILQIVILRKDR